MKLCSSLERLLRMGMGSRLATQCVLQTFLPQKFLSTVEACTLQLGVIEKSNSSLHLSRQNWDLAHLKRTYATSTPTNIYGPACNSLSLSNYSTVGLNWHQLRSRMATLYHLPVHF